VDQTDYWGRAVVWPAFCMVSGVIFQHFSIKEKVLYLLTTGFFITLLLPGMPVINNLFTGAIFIYSWAYGRPDEKWSTLRHRKEIVCMLLFFGVHIISALLSHNRKEGFEMLVLRLPLLIFPLSLGLLTIRTALKDRIIQAYCLVISLGGLVCAVYAYIRWARTGDGVYLYNDSLTEVLKIQSSYYALMVLLAVAGFIYLLGKRYFSKAQSYYIWGIILLLMLFHFMLASRISITILYTGLLIVVGSYIVRHRRMGLAIGLMLALVVGLGLCVKLLPKTLNRFRELEYPAYSFTRVAPESHYNGTLTPDQWNGANIRLAIWKCGWELGRAHWLTGVQLGDKQDSLMGKYREKGFTFGLLNKRNMHNNYLDIFCAFGVVGIVLFALGYLVIPLWKAVRMSDLLGLALILAMGVSMGVESYFDRSLGCLLMGFFFSFIAAYKDRALRVVS
jgi:O-antigen ligase